MVDKMREAADAAALQERGEARLSAAPRGWMVSVGGEGGVTTESFFFMGACVPVCGPLITGQTLVYHGSCLHILTQLLLTCTMRELSKKKKNQI